MEIPLIALFILFGLLALLLSIATEVLDRKLKAAKAEVQEVEEKIRGAAELSRELYTITENKAGAIFSGFLVNSFLRLEKAEKENRPSTLYVAYMTCFATAILCDVVWVVSGIAMMVAFVSAF